MEVNKEAEEGPSSPPPSPARPPSLSLCGSAPVLMRGQSLPPDTLGSLTYIIGPFRDIQTWIAAVAVRSAAHSSSSVLRLPSGQSGQNAELNSTIKDILRAV